MDITETAKMIREMLADGGLLCLLISHDGDGTEDADLPPEIDGVLTKPFFVSALRGKFAEIYTERGPSKAETVVKEQRGLEGRHFLVAEDNEINGEILVELLDIEGATCEILRNGKLASEHFIASAPGSYDAVLMDVQMPVMNGYEATKVIRDSCHEEAKTIPIVAMSANAFDDDLKKSVECGMNGHLSKPVEVDKLYRTLDKVIRGGAEGFYHI